MEAIASLKLSLKLAKDREQTLQDELIVLRAKYCDTDDIHVPDRQRHDVNTRSPTFSLCTRWANKYCNVMESTR